MFDEVRMSMKPGAETVGSYFDYLMPRISDLPAWPPDVFCLAAAILQKSGAYTAAVNDDRPRVKLPKGMTWPQHVEEVGKQWRRNFKQPPAAMQSAWSLIRKNWKLPLSELRRNSQATAALFQLLACADEACVGVGMSISRPATRTGWEDFTKDHFLWDAEEGLLKTIREGSTLCHRIHPSKARVLPKMHTPQNGLTIRSFSHYLSYCSSTEIKPEWYSFGTDIQEHSLNLLVIPWPQTVLPIQFAATKKIKLGDMVERGSYGLFTYQAGLGPTVRRIRQILEASEKCVGRVDGVILPELAVSPKEHEALANTIVSDKRFLVCGVGHAGKNSCCGSNYLTVDMFLPGSSLRVPLSQSKHHRWKMDKSQIMQYGIGSNLHPEANWWEHISLGERKLMFVSLRPWLTMSVLICEDLARPDPMGDLVRAVGPNLVIALLMDGPQLSGRWPARYATSLADDPGSSVLTVTSIGMSSLSRPRSGEDRHRVIALWKDPRSGSAREVELPAGAAGLILNITVEYAEEWTADGRGDGGVSGYPILAGYHGICLGV
jgi:hypothetical protein